MQNPSGFQLVKPGIAALVAIGLAAATASLISLFVLKPLHNSQVENQLDQVSADHIAYRVDQHQSQIMAQANTIATSIKLTQLIKNQDSAALKLEESRLREMIPGAIKVRIFARGKAAVEPQSTPPFSYTSLDLVNQAEQGGSVYPEAILTDGRWLLGLAAPIKTASDTKIHGTLFIYLEITSLSDALSNHIEGKLSLSQVFRGAENKIFLNIGEAASESTAPLLRESINKNWQISFQRNALPVEVIPNFLYLLPGLLTLVIGVAGTLVGFIRINKAVEEEAANLSHQISGLAKGAPLKHIEFKIAQFAMLLSKLGQVERTLQQATSLRSKTFHDLEPVVDVLGEMPKGHPDKPPEVDVSEIFRAYDIRGIVGKNLTLEVVERIGRCIGTEALAAGETSLTIAGDGRNSTPQLMEALSEGILSTGCDVVNIGLTPTPVLYFATHHLPNNSGVMITGSHNPVNYNGLKIVLNGRTLVDEDIQKLYKLYQAGDFTTGKGKASTTNVEQNYLDTVIDDVVLAQPLKVVVDCGNGIAGKLLPDLLTQLGCEVIPLYCDVDGDFPNHHPDPIVPENLADLIVTVKSQKADLGIALDGDGDRLVAITKQGEIVWPDKLLMLFAKDVISRNPGCDVVFDVKCSRHLSNTISQYGGRPIISRTGHSFLKAMMLETGALLGGELSGHICFKERWYGFDDGLYSAARLLEYIGAQNTGLAELLADFPDTVSTSEIQIAVKENTKFNIVEKLISNGGFEGAKLISIDGLRAEYSDSWGLVRASNTNPVLTLRFEADDEAALENIQNLFRKKLSAIDSKLTF